MNIDTNCAYWWIMAITLVCSSASPADKAKTVSPEFNEEDSTESLQKAIDSGAARIIVRNTGKPWIVRPIKLAGNQEIVFEFGVEVVAKKGEFRGKNDYMFTASGKSNVTLTGYGATLRMRKADYQRAPYVKSEHRMCVAILSCDNVTIQGLTLKDSGGDGIYLGVDRKGGKPRNENVVIRDVLCDNNHRQGMSIISARNLLVERCVFSNTSGANPESGIDLEPNLPNQELSDIVIRDCVIEKNRRKQLHVWPGKLKKNSKPVSVLFENCRVSGGMTGIHVGYVWDTGPSGTITFRSCLVENSKHHGIWLRDKSVNSIRVVFDNCVLRNTALEQKKAERGTKVSVEGPISMYTLHKVTAKQGGVMFRNCVVVDDKNRPFFRASDPVEFAPDGLFDITGNMDIVNPHGARTEFSVPSNGFDVKITEHGKMPEGIRKRLKGLESNLPSAGTVRRQRLHENVEEYLNLTNPMKK